MNDITLRKRVEQNLNESEQRYRMLFDLSNDSNVLIDAETGKIEESNRIAHDHLGYSKEEFLQLSIAAIEAAGIRRRSRSAHPDHHHAGERYIQNQAQDQGRSCSRRTGKGKSHFHGGKAIPVEHMARS
ncbi:MAG: PAS domain S-box protein [Gammaproteobacteria bacterium]|nr:PAS domain S-box protein [Gammaproteobacteria bacterium]